MKKIGAFLIPFFACQVVSAKIPHMDLEMTTQEYRRLMVETSNSKTRLTDDPAINYAINLGERLNQWIEVLNNSRTPENAIRLTSPSTRRGHPIDRPNTYSPKIIAEETLKNLKDLPSQMINVLMNYGEFPTSLEIDDAVFIRASKPIDTNYQSAVRFRTLIKYKDEYIQEAKRDVRGYHYLVENKIGAFELKDVASIDPMVLPRIQDALKLICINDFRESVVSCEEKVKVATAKNTLSYHYNTYFPFAKEVWNKFFVIPKEGKRTDIHWSENSATIPFNTPTISRFIPYLQNNVEDEFRWNGWGLHIEFGNYENGPVLKFEAGVTPHVSGQNLIVMDANQSTEEYESQWTIRHEFGHILGLPDCYHEFYDAKKEVFVNYQLDITDLMCSRAGNMNERIYLELKKVYAP